MIVIIVATAVTYAFEVNKMHWFSLTGNVTAGVPPFQLPAFSVVDPKSNTTYTFTDIASVRTGSRELSDDDVQIVLF